ncbi:hypothetical protein FOZ63_026152, partial [Perkinsus olseni]
GAYCKDWQDSAGRVCFPLSNLSCYCKKLRQVAPIVSSPGQQPPGWVPVDCVYPTTTPPPLTTPAPSTSNCRPLYSMVILSSFPFCLAISLVLAQGNVSSTTPSSTSGASTTPSVTSTTSTAPVSTTPPPTKYCPIGWCLDTQWFKGRPCITPKPSDLKLCWDNFCKADANNRDIHPTNAQGRGQGTYCKDWQDPAGRICFHDIRLPCHCDSFNSTPFALSSRDGWSVADPCSYPPPPGPLTSASPASRTTTSAPTSPTAGPLSDSSGVRPAVILYMALACILSLFFVR